ncbi:hypothetical protein KQ910_05940 [Reyranella sp. MMS21-HV4-11]|uniref:ATP-grasp domain-containing protein n=1 Tax=Reyranella humidisoli TaxID=2849149 RepID=A0ABS6IFP8_9HYPH|nr:hypothetical protein [Reyranella sp. MMS21-HV4-11]MBU8873295.1 hypothetical protein [Reyranella sp. MMS21-HV4-11]
MTPRLTPDSDTSGPAQRPRAGLWPGLICSLPKPLLVVPMVVQWLALSLRYRSLSLPSAADPMIDAGGLAGESKIAYFAQVGDAGRPWLALTAAVVSGPDAAARAGAAMAALGLDFPIIAKPDIGWCGFGVRRIDDHAALEAYCDAYPTGESLLVQECLDLPGEAGLFYVRRPAETRGRLLSLTIRTPPTVRGDGTSSLRALLARDERLRGRTALYESAALDRVPDAGTDVALAAVWSYRMGGLYRDCSEAITPALEERIDAVATSMPHLHVARFDIRFAGLAELQKGTFKILEINGAGSEAIEFFDPAVPFFTAYRGILAKQAMVFALAAENRAAGFAPCGWRALLRAFRHQARLLDRYPASN